MARGHPKKKENEGGRANLQFRTRKLNVEHFYDDQFRSNFAGDSGSREIQMIVLYSWGDKKAARLGVSRDHGISELPFPSGFK